MTLVPSWPSGCASSWGARDLKGIAGPVRAWAACDQFPSKAASLLRGRYAAQDQSAAVAAEAGELTFEGPVSENKRVSRATSVSWRPTAELERAVGAFGALRRFGSGVFGRRPLIGSPPALERR